MCVSVSSAQTHLQPFQLLLEVVLIHKLDFAELLLIFQVLLSHQLYLPKNLSRPVAGSPSGWSGGGEWWGCNTEIMGRQARLKGKRGSGRQLEQPGLGNREVEVSLEAAAAILWSGAAWQGKWSPPWGRGQHAGGCTPNVPSAMTGHRGSGG